MRKSIVCVMLVLLVGCGSGASNPTSSDPVAGAASLQSPTPPASVPPVLRSVWATTEDALTYSAAYQSNAVVLLIDSWGESHDTLALQLRQRGVGVLVFVEQCFYPVPRSGWDGCWVNVERWSKPFKDAGILYGYHVMDEPFKHGVPASVRNEANAYVRAKGYDLLGTEWIEYVSDQKMYKFPRPAGLRWYAVTCYDFGGSGVKHAPWYFQNCAEEYERHPDWDTVVGQGFDAGNGVPPRDQWESLAAKLNRGIIWWAYGE